MRRLAQSVRKLLDRAQRRFIRSRPGSVLILVVALLVLIALIAMAFMSVAQDDRIASAQHANNTEIDLLLDGMIDVVKGNIVSDLFAQGKFRRSVRYNTGDPGSYNYVTGLGDSPATINDGTHFLASRLPELSGETASHVQAAPGTGNQPFWRYITAPLIGVSFSSPVPPAGTSFLQNQSGNYYTQRQSSAPAPKPLYPSSLMVNGQPMPAWVDNPDNPTGWMLAADADGDGIADAGLVKLPIGPINGLTYYVAVRVIDNAAAVNANIAWQHNPYISANPAAPYLPGDFFPTNVDLVDLLLGADANVAAAGSGINQLLNFRFGLPLNAAGALAATQVSAAPLPPLYPYDDNGVPRALSLGGDIDYCSFAEGAWNGLGRRLKNPSSWSDPSYAVNQTQFAPLSIGESLALARNFIIRDTGSASLLETVLPNSLASAATPGWTPTSPYTPGDTLDWFYNQSTNTGNFGFLQTYLSTGFNMTPLRSVLTTENGVSNFCPGKFYDVGPATATSTNVSITSWVPPATPPARGFRFGDSAIVTYTDNTANATYNRRYVCINPNQILPVPPAVVRDPNAANVRASLAWTLDNDTWVYQPWTTNPVKTSVNTATFGQLLLAYWSVMAEQIRPSDGTWAPPFPLNPDLPTPTTADPRSSPRMFRNPIRIQPSTPPAPPSNTFWQLSPVQVMQLRAGLAAVNTIDLRDGDDDVTARTVHLTDFNPKTQPNSRMQDVIATVYGAERQPFITKVYATNEPVPNATSPSLSQPGYVAIELYNPDPVRGLNLSGYALGTIPRPAAPGSAAPPNFNPTLVAWGSNTAWFGTNANGSNAPTIPHYVPGTAPVLPFVVVASSDTPPPGITLPANVVKPGANGRVSAGQVALYVVQNLVPPTSVAPGPGLSDGALGNELMLFRPRRGDGTPTSSAYINTSGFLAATPAPATPGPTLLSSPPQHQPYPAYHEGVVLGDLSTGTYTPNLADMVPVDSYDFTGLNTLVHPATDTPTEWYYVRPVDPTNVQPWAWHFVYPGHYAFLPPNSSGAPTPRLVDGTWSSDIPIMGGNVGAALTAAGVPLAGQVPFGITPTVIKPGYRDMPLQLNSSDFAGPNINRASSSGPSLVAFPYGGFARNGDILQVPFIGSYRLAIPDLAGNAAGTLAVIEMNPVTIDSAFALGLAQGPAFQEPSESQFPFSHNANGLWDPIFNGVAPFGTPVENVGRFCPLDPVDFGLPANSTTPPNDFVPAAGTIPQQWLYHFGTRLLDYLTVQSPQADYTPEADPGQSDWSQPTTTTGQADWYGKYSAGNGDVPETSPCQVANSTVGVANAEPGNPNGVTEETASTNGLININSAPWRVLAAVPWVPPDYTSFDGTNRDTSRKAMNIDIGLSIARFRDADDGSGRPHGPFLSIFELNNVPIYQFVPVPGTSLLSGTLFRNLLNDQPPPYTAEQGNITPAYQRDTVLNDFKTKFTMLSRASNLITTRSDSFTVYVLLQGWRNAEANSATLVVQRRAAFRLDRTGITPVNPSTPAITRIPTN